MIVTYIKQKQLQKKSYKYKYTTPGFEEFMKMKMEWVFRFFYSFKNVENILRDERFRFDLFLNRRRNILDIFFM